MGAQISIDKHVSTLDDILEMSPSYFDKIKFESKISQNITQHLKVNIIETMQALAIIYVYRFGNSVKIKENLILLSQHLFSSITCKIVDFSFHLKKLT